MGVLGRYMTPQQHELIDHTGIPGVGAGGSDVDALNDLTDVVITAAASGDFLYHNGTNWVDSAHATVHDALDHTAAMASVILTDISDVDTSGLANGEILVWNAAGSVWENATNGAGVSDHGGLSGLSDDDHTQYALANATRGAFPNTQLAFWPGDLTVGDGDRRMPIGYNATITSVRIMCVTAPTGASVLLNVKKNGTTDLFSGADRPTITAGNNAGVSTTFVGTTNQVSAGDWLTFDVDQIGSTLPGSHLTVLVQMVIR